MLVVRTFVKYEYLNFYKKKFKLHLKANKACKKIKIMFAFRQTSQKNTNPKKQIYCCNVLIYIKQPIIYLIFSAYAALIKSSEDFCLEGIEIYNANLK